MIGTMKKKEFDCVRMKHEIQQQLRERRAGLSSDERRRAMEENIQSDPILARLWREAKRIEPAGESAQKPT